MGAKILDGKALADKIVASVAEEAAALKKKAGRPPKLVAVLVGDDPSSQTYVSNKHKDCLKAGFSSEVRTLPASTTRKALLKVVDELNNDDLVDGFIVQLPLPEGLDEEEVIEAISPEKDVDGFHPNNVGKLLIGEKCFAPATPKGIIRLLKENNVEMEGKNAVIVGRSNIVGKPLALLLLKENATVTVCHSKTKDLKEVTSKADILVAAVGKPGLITADHVKKGAVVVDVGTTRIEGNIKGDVVFDEVKQKASAITPVPGGVGPMTRAMLLENTLEAFKKRNGF